MQFDELIWIIQMHILTPQPPLVQVHPFIEIIVKDVFWR
jgi:hypothetical protein